MKVATVVLVLLGVAQAGNVQNVIANLKADIEKEKADLVKSLDDANASLNNLNEESAKNVADLKDAISQGNDDADTAAAESQKQSGVAAAAEGTITKVQERINKIKASVKKARGDMRDATSAFTHEERALTSDISMLNRAKNVLSNQGGQDALVQFVPVLKALALSHGIKSSTDDDELSLSLLQSKDNGVIDLINELHGECAEKLRGLRLGFAQHRGDAKVAILSLTQALDSAHQQKANAQAERDESAGAGKQADGEAATAAENVRTKEGVLDELVKTTAAQVRAMKASMQHFRAAIDKSQSSIAALDNADGSGNFLQVRSRSVKDDVVEGLKDAAENHHSLRLAQLAVGVNTMGMNQAMEMLRKVLKETKKELQDMVGMQEKCKNDKAAAAQGQNAAQKGHDKAAAKHMEWSGKVDLAKEKAESTAKTINESEGANADAVARYGKAETDHNADDKDSSDTIGELEKVSGVLEGSAKGLIDSILETEREKLSNINSDWKNTDAAESDRAQAYKVTMAQLNAEKDGQANTSALAVSAAEEAAAGVADAKSELKDAEEKVAIVDEQCAVPVKTRQQVIDGHRETIEAVKDAIKILED